ncbi:MAG: HD domain-containing phosphohydrolase [Sphingomonadales bacterium]
MKILLVDDDANILSGYRRQLRKHYDLYLALSGQEGLKAIKRDGPFAVVVADMRMPGMDGIEFLGKVKEIAPLSVRMMLTGNADQQTAISAINSGNIFRFNTKPCPPEKFKASLDICIEQYRLLTLERDLLEKTLAGSVKLLTDVVALTNPASFGKVGVIRAWASTVAERLERNKAWQINMAAMLAPLGQIALPPQILAKKAVGQELTPAEQKICHKVPAVGKSLIENIPRLKPVSEIVYYQDKGFDGSGFPDDSVAGKDLPLGARLLKILNDLNKVCAGSAPDNHAFRSLAKQSALYDPELLAIARSCLAVDHEETGGEEEVISLPLYRIMPGFRLVEDLETEDGKLLLAAGQEISRAQLDIFTSFDESWRIKQPVRVIRPAIEPRDDEAGVQEPPDQGEIKAE